MNAEKLATVHQTVQRRPFLSEKGLRQLIFRATENGLDESGAVRRLGRRVLIDLEAFDRWVEESSGAG